jgi:exopolyphosphatase/guanosine-5'-triphosphate,3'-diphosphate pyrophosphatase
MRVAVIDVGSNSIKLLVADPGSDGVPIEVSSRTLESRISRGIGSERPSLSPEGITRGLDAIRSLAIEAHDLGALRTEVVATSAVRDAANGADFVARVRDGAGLAVRILSGDEEANLIGRGLTTDPGLRSLADFRVFDLGGGSLECLSFTDRKVDRAVSLRLGCVRLTERFVAPGGGPLLATEASSIGAHVRRELAASGFPACTVPGGDVIGTGGTLTTVRAMVAAAHSVRISEANPRIDLELLRQTLDRVGSLDLEKRKVVPGLAASRADVFPTALVTLLALADACGIGAFRHSFRNLRWGVASELLS